jgi:hypothetical protein
VDATAAPISASKLGVELVGRHGKAVGFEPHLRPAPFEVREG